VRSTPVFNVNKELENPKRREFMKARIKHAIAIGAAISLVPLAQAVAGIDIEAGDWKLDFSGNINAFYVNASCDHGENTSVTGGLACTGDNATSVRNGLLPAAFVFTASTRQDNLDISATIGLYPGINSSAAAGVNGAGLPAALQTPGIDARQEFLTFGDASWGTVKMGRDIGIFAKDAILDDMTLLGVGTASGNAAPGNTSLGRIGLGYIYTDWIPQITYTTPNLSGFTASVGAFTPLDDGNYTSHNSPQWQGGVSYVFGDPKSAALSGKVWVDAVTQQAKAPTNCPAPPAAQFCVAENSALGIQNSTKGTGVDGGVKLDVAGFEGVLYGYYGKGIGTTGLYILATSAAGNERKSDGGYAQLTYKIDRLKLGLSYGVSELKLASDEQAFQLNPGTGTSTGVYASDLVHRNESGVFGAYYSLTKSLTLVGEFIHTEAQAWNGNEAIENDVALGGILFF
jgi:predicted porin